MIPASEHQDLLVHMEWADALVWKAARALPAARTDRRLRDLLYHLHLAQRVYLQVCRGDGLEVPKAEDFREPSAVEQWTRPYYAQARAFVSGLDEATLAKPVEFPWAAEVLKRSGRTSPATLGESLLQVVLHSTYHRGQASARLRELGGEPPLTDFIAWLWLGRPAPQW
jgi:uncharacterized damage-inducible protein DinB